MMTLLTLVQFVGLFVVLPAAASAWLKIDVVNTLRLRLPPARSVLAALLIGSSTWAVAHTLLWLQQRALPASKALEEFSKQMEAQFAEQPLWVMIVLLAVVPAVCEELLFRGFLLSGLSAGMRKWPAIIAAGAIFGVFHFILDRVPITALMGILLGYICWQSRSIFPGMLVHAMHNSAMIVLSHSEVLAKWLHLDKLEPGSMLPARMLLPAVILLAIGIAVLASLRRSSPAAESASAEPTPPPA